MYVVIKTSFDGDSYGIFTKMKDAKDSFVDAVKSDLYHGVYLAKPTNPEDFGFGSRGELYGVETILHWSQDEDDAEEFLSGICGVCGGDASHCDGC